MNIKRQKLEGTVSFFNAEKNFGFISNRDSSGIIRQWFFHAARLSRCEVEIQDIQIGMFARFQESDAPVKPGNFPYAVNVELFLDSPGGGAQ